MLKVRKVSLNLVVVTLGVGLVFTTLAQAFRTEATPVMAQPKMLELLQTNQRPGEMMSSVRDGLGKAKRMNSGVLVIYDHVTDENRFAERVHRNPGIRSFSGIIAMVTLDPERRDAQEFMKLHKIGDKSAILVLDKKGSVVLRLVEPGQNVKLAQALQKLIFQ